MYILGTKYWGSHDASACLVKDGCLIVAIEEERLTRVKHAPYSAPVNAVRACLQYAGITINDVDFVVCPRSAPSAQRRSVLPHILANLPIYVRMHGWQTGTLALQSFLNLGVLSLDVMLRRHFGYVPPIVSIAHDQAHLAGAFYCSPFDQAAILHIEGFAELTTTVLAQGDYAGVHRAHEILFPHSLGCFYAAFTDWLGFEANNGEGKVMGLAPYGEPRYSLDHVVRRTPAGFEYDGRYGLNRAGRKLVREFGPRRRPGEGFSRHHKDVAASVQAKLEEVGMHLLHIAMDRIPSDNVCLSGGVALNVKMNGRLLRCGLVNDLFVLPAANDAGLSIGAAFELCRRLGRAISYAMDDAYLGPSYSESAIQEAIERHGLVHEYHKDIPAVVADLLVDGLLVGWFQGRMEFGPRALGNRSILADPRDPTMKDKINLRVKHREPFRPFCPSILEEAKDDYLDKAISSPFMTMAFQARPGARDRIPAVVHVDGSVRPQTVREEANPRFHQLISHFAKATGVSAVLNTSLNVRGEPICCTPEDALNCFLNTDMDAIALGSYLVRKSSNTHIVG